MPSEQTWASVGKVLAAAAAIVALVLGLIQISEALSGPQVIAIVEERQNVLTPEHRERLDVHVSRTELEKLISDREGAKESSTKILHAVKEYLKKENHLSLLNLESVFDSTAWHVTIFNKSSKVAKDVKVIFPGRGKVDIIEGAYGSVDMDQPPTAWKKEITVGSVPPRATVQLLIWPDRAAYATMADAEIGLVHDGGSGVVRKSLNFYGWDAELIAWFLAQSIITRSTLVVGLLLLFGLLIWTLYKRGYLVLRPKTRTEKQAAAADSDLTR
jgi:hypothetical protein